MAPWFIALESSGEYMGMRFGRIAPGKSDPEWIFVRHAEHDGIGAFAEIFRKRGAPFESLPQAKHPSAPSLFSLFQLLKMHLRPRRRLHWKNLGQSIKSNGAPQPPLAFAWHVFDEAKMAEIRRVCNSAGVTVNSFLLKNLTKAIRPSLEDPLSTVPWMIPVNLRGKVDCGRDTANHMGHITAKVGPSNSAQDIHNQIYAAMERKEHCANWFAYELGRFTTHRMRKFLIKRELATSEWNLGAFSNLGVWDPEKKIIQPACLGSWLVCPPVVRFQLIGAGCVTFQNRLSLTIQAHPELTTEPQVCEEWISAWVGEIELDLAAGLTNASMLSEKDAEVRI